MIFVMALFNWLYKQYRKAARFFEKWSHRLRGHVAVTVIWHDGGVPFTGYALEVFSNYNGWMYFDIVGHKEPLKADAYADDITVGG